MVCGEYKQIITIILFYERILGNLSWNSKDKLKVESVVSCDLWVVYINIFYGIWDEYLQFWCYACGNTIHFKAKPTR